MPSLVFQPQETRVEPALTAPDAQGANFTPAVGQALENLGQQGVRLGADMNRVQSMQENADAAAALRKNVFKGYVDFTDYMEQQKSQVPENGAGYAKKFLDSFTNWQDKLVAQQPTSQTKRMAAESAATLGEHFYAHASSWENETRRAWRTSQLDESITGGAALIDKDPSLYQPMLQESLEGIKAVTGDLHPEQSVALANKTKAMFAQAASLSWARSHPQDTVNAIMPTVPQSPNSIPAKITSAARSAGVNPQSALAIAQFESGMDPAAQNPKSSANGIYQMIGDTANQYFKPEADRANPDAQIDAGMRFMADNARALKDTFGHEPTTAELYLSHLLGLGGAMALMKSNNSTPFVDVVRGYDAKNANAIVANNGFTGLNVGQVKQKIASWMQDASIKTAGLAAAPTHGTPEADDAATADTDLPWLNGLTPNERQAILTHAQNNLKKDDAGMRAIFDQQYNDATAALQNGEMPPKLPTFDDGVRAGIPANVMSQKMSELNRWQNYGAAFAQLSKQAPTEQMQTLAQMRPVAGEPGYAQKLEMYNHADNAIQQISQQRQADPIAYDQARGLQVTQPLDFSSTQFLTGPLAGRFIQAEQATTKNGVPYQVFSKQEATGLGQFLQKADAQTGLQYLQSIRAAADTPEHFTAAMAQIAPQHPILAVAGQIAVHDQATALMVLNGDRIMNPGRNGTDREDKLKFLMPPAEKFEAAWESARGQAYQGLPQTSRDDLSAAIAYYAASQPAGGRGLALDTTLFKKAVDAVSPAQVYNNKTVLVPAGTDATKFADHVAAKWDGALKAYGLDAKDYPAGAYSLVSAGEDGKYTPVNGTMPLVSGGRKVIIDLSDTPHIPMSPAPTEPDTSRPLKGKQLTVADLRMQRHFR